MTRQSIEQMIRARAGLILDHPFFGSLATKLRLIEDTTCKTAWTDGTYLGFNPEFISGLKLPEIKGLWAHEVMHCACAHHVRRGTREHRKWNVAGDLAINLILEESKMALPAGALLDARFKDKAAEAIYAMLPEQDSGEGGSGTGSGQDKDKQGKGKQDNGKQDNGKQDNGKQDKGSQDKDKMGGDSGAGFGEVRDAGSHDGKNASPGDIAKQEQDWKVAISQAAQQARAAGKLPGGLDRIVREMVHPKVDWRSVLRQFIEASSRNDYSWTAPNRRYVMQGVYLPSIISNELPDIVIAVDTSMSIRDEELKQFSAEISSILAGYQTTIHVIYCDQAFQGTQTLSSEDLPITLESKGGGGTSFIPPFEWVEENDIMPACLIYLTDMKCYKFPPEPDFPVLWVSTIPVRNQPSFGDVIEM